MISSVNGAVVYLAPQVIAPLSASTQAIALTMATRPDLVAQAGVTDRAAASHGAAAQVARLTPDAVGKVEPVVSADGHVDVYA